MKKKIVLFGVLILLIALFPAVAQVCSPVDATISADFTKDGAGNFCWESTCLGDYVNSWNLSKLTINGVNYTNLYVASSNYPALVNGKYYIVYEGSYAWSHFEARGTCAVVPTDPPITPAPTIAPTDPTVTAVPGVGDVSMSPSTVNAAVGNPVSFSIMVNSGTQRVAAYGIDITYNSNILGSPAVDDGADGFVSAVNTNTPGLIVTSGFDASGTGPGSNLELLIISFAANNSGTSAIGITVDQLVDENTATIGTPNGIGGSVIVDGTITAAPTATPIITVAPTAPPGVGDVSMSPSTVNANIGDPVSFSIMVNSGTQRVAAYGIDITYNSSILGSPAVDDGADGFVSAVNTNTPGLIITSGFDASGTGPGTNLELLIISFAANASGTSAIGITVNQLVDENTTTIGIPNGIGGSVIVEGTITAAPTATPIITDAPTATPVITDAPTTPPITNCTCDSGCSTIVNITSPFVKNGSGTFCWQAPCLGDYINSWNLTTLEINGVDFTNKYAAPSQYPAPIDGVYYIYYVGKWDWSHFEMNGTCIPTIPTTAPTATPVITIAPTATPVITIAPTDPPVITPEPGVGDVSMYPSTVNANIGDPVSFSIMVNSGTQRVAAYGIDITYNSSILGSPAVDDGADGFVSAVNTNTPGLIITSGFDASGTGPGTNLELLIISFAANASGTSAIGITVNQLVDENTTTIGIPNGIGGSVIVEGTITAAPTATPVITEPPVTPEPGVGDVSMYPSTVNANIGDPVSFSIMVNSGTQRVAAYGINITYNSNILGNPGVDDGADGFVSAINTNTPGLIITSGFDASGTGPGANLELLIISFTANNSGTSAIGITVNQLVDENTTTIGIPNGIGGSVIVEGTITAAPTATPVITEPPVTPEPGVGDVSMVPSTVNGTVGQPVSFEIHVNSGTSRLAAYGMNITYSASILGNPAVDDGADGFVSAVNTNTPGLIIASGFDASGTGPGADLELLIVTFDAIADGSSAIGITVNQLVDENTTTIGIPNGIGGTVVIESAPTIAPTATPVITDAPTIAPTATPVITDAPTIAPTATPVITDAPTIAPTATPVITDAPTAVPTTPPVIKSAGSVWLDPSSQNVSNGAAFTLDVHCHTGDSYLAAYGIDFYFDTSVINIDTSVSKIVEKGPDGFLAASNTGTPGKIVTSGFDASGVGPSSDLYLLIIHMVGAGSGTSAVDIDVRSFVDETTTVIGTPTGIPGSVTVN